MHTVRTLGLMGTGVIGAGWAARALHFGIDVIAADVKPGDGTASCATQSPMPNPRWRG